MISRGAGIIELGHVDILIFIRHSTTRQLFSRNHPNFITGYIFFVYLSKLLDFTKFAGRNSYALQYELSLQQYTEIKVHYRVTE